MKKNFSFLVILLLGYLFFLTAAYASPVAEIETLIVPSDTKQFQVNLNIFTDGSDISSVAFGIDFDASWTLSNVTFGSLPNYWIPTWVKGKHTFGATDFGYPATPLIDTTPFAILTFSSSAENYFSNKSLDINFTFIEFTDSNGNIIENVTSAPGKISASVPVPASLLLFATGLTGLFGIRRKMK